MQCPDSTEVYVFSYCHCQPSWQGIEHLQIFSIFIVFCGVCVGLNMLQHLNAIIWVEACALFYTYVNIEVLSTSYR